MTDQDLLAAVETAITGLISGGAQAYSIGGRQVTKLDLKNLFEMRKQLQFSVARQTGLGVGVAQFRKPE